MIKTLFVDIGGVLLTNGWDHLDRELAAKTFHFDLKEMEARHRLTFNIFEIGKISLEEYLNRILFYKKQDFTQEQFQKFMFERSKPFPEMIELVRNLKSKYRLKVAVISNEGRELNTYRINKFGLAEFIDFFFSSCFVHFQKPDNEIFQMALDASQTPPDQAIFVDDRKLFVEVAEKFGMHGLHHIDYESTLVKLEKFGLK